MRIHEGVGLDFWPGVGSRWIKMDQDGSVGAACCLWPFAQRFHRIFGQPFHKIQGFRLDLGKDFELNQLRFCGLAGNVLSLLNVYDMLCYSSWMYRYATVCSQLAHGTAPSEFDRS